MPDRLPEGVAEVRNTLSLCPTHHRAWDIDVLTVTSEFRVRVERARLRNVGLPATARMLPDFDGRGIVLPRDERLRPDVDLLAKRAALVA